MVCTRSFVRPSFFLSLWHFRDNISIKLNVSVPISLSVALVARTFSATSFIDVRPVGFLGCKNRLELLRFLAGCRKKRLNQVYLSYILAYFYCGPFLCIVSFRWYVFYHGWPALMAMLWVAGSNSSGFPAALHWYFCYVSYYLSNQFMANKILLLVFG